jgi:hypothetical protein
LRKVDADDLEAFCEKACCRDTRAAAEVQYSGAGGQPPRELGDEAVSRIPLDASAA